MQTTHQNPRFQIRSRSIRRTQRYQRWQRIRTQNECASMVRAQIVYLPGIDVDEELFAEKLDGLEI